MAGTAEHAGHVELAELLGGGGARDGLRRRLGRVSQALVGRPYLAFPLGGGPDQVERLTLGIDAFDCVTFVETVVALGRCRNPEDFEGELARLRYDGGLIDWSSRNHYMTLWVERNALAGSVRPVDGRGFRDEAEPRMLASLAGFSPVTRRLRYLPCELAPGFAWATGDVLLFVSHRKDLDFFHTGVAVAGEVPHVRHASRSRGMVVEESLADFIAHADPEGVAAARPVDPWAHPLRPRRAHLP
jgi:hypothetical protein